MKRILSLILLFISVPQIVYSACSWVDNTGTVASNAVSDITDCVTDASSKTGNVIINLLSDTANGGAETWNVSDLSINMSSGFANVTGLTLIGAGTLPTGCDPSDSGSATGCGASTSGGTSIILNSHNIVITGETDKKIRVSNITVSGTGVTNEGFIDITGDSNVIAGGGFRIDHITSTATGLFVATRTLSTTGVADSNNITASGQRNNINGEVNSDGGNTSWATAENLGTSGAIYFEDNWVYQLKDGGSCASPIMFADVTNGGRVVHRYNYMKNTYIGGHDASSNERGNFSHEVYNNLMVHDCTPGTGNDFMDIRGGIAIVYNNEMITLSDCDLLGCGTDAIRLVNYRSSDSGTASPWTDGCDYDSAFKVCVGSGINFSTCTDDSDCGGTPGSCQYADDPLGDGEGYACRDQTGLGTDNDSYPSLYWNNYLTQYDNGNTRTIHYPIVDPSGYNATHIVKDRDYCDDSGNPGTMPTTCNSIETVYSAYTYPHPLTGDIVAPELSSASVNGLNVQAVMTEPATVNTIGTWTMDCDGDTNYALTYQSGSGTTTFNFTSATAATNGQTCDLTFVGGADYIEDDAGNDLANFADQAMTNNTPIGNPSIPYSGQGDATLDSGGTSTVLNSGYGSTLIH